VFATRSILLNLAEYFLSASEDLHALLLTVRQEPTRTSRSDERAAEADASLGEGGGGEGGAGGAASAASDLVDVVFELRALNVSGKPAKRRTPGSDMSLWEGDYSPTSHPKGVTTGFRLWLAHKLVISHEGTTESADGGATCRFRLSYQLQRGRRLAAGTTEPSPHFDPADAIVTPKVLIVERCAPLREALTRYVRAWHFEAECCDDLAEARRVVASDYDLSMVVINVHDMESDSTLMPDEGSSREDGTVPEYLEVLEMKKRDVFMGLPVIAMSPFKLQSFSFHRGQKLSTGRALNPTDWHVLIKPVSAHQLLSALTDALADEPDGSLAREGAPETPMGRWAELQQTPLGGIARHPNASFAARRIRVLVVDDQPVKHNMIRWMLESQGMQCDMAMDGFECVHNVEESDYDVILMDVNMPGMNGLDATEQIRNFEKMPDSGSLHTHIPIVGMSCQVPDVGTVYNPRPPHDGSDGGLSHLNDTPEMDDYLEDPLRQQDMIEKVHKWARWTREENLPVIGIHVILEVANGDHAVLVNIIDEFVRTAFLQLGSLRNAFIGSSEQVLSSGCEVIRSSARRFGAVWLVRAASHLMYLLSMAQLHRIQGIQEMDLSIGVDARIDALRACEDEIIVISKCAEKLREHINLPSSNPSERGNLSNISETQADWPADGDGDGGEATAAPLPPQPSKPPIESAAVDG
jgi:CheY-like chemotaxis protein